MEHVRLAEIITERLGSESWLRLYRYGAVSIVTTFVSQFVLLVGHGVLDFAATPTNAVAVSVAAVPGFLLNRMWVWDLSGPSSLRREVLPFWGFTLAGLLLSTAAVAVVSGLTHSTAAVAAANIGAFGVLWVAKFFVLDTVVFAPRFGADEPAVAGVPAI